ncbi:galactose oxidase [Xylariaceae sp. AK1471]|nr:galactose oxidase [Xylariaceae sp. AK1471]
MADSSRSHTSSSNRSRTVRAQKISESGSSSTRGETSDRIPPIRSHTPGHLASKSHGGSGGPPSSSSSRRKASEPSIRQRSQSVAAKSAYASPPPQPTPTPVPTLTLRRNGDPQNDPQAGSSTDGKDSDSRRPLVMRSTSAIATKPSSLAIPSSTAPRKPSASPRQPRGVYTPFPPLQDPLTAADVPAAPSSGMYWSRAPVSGAPHKPLRAHTTTLVGSNIFVFGGCDSRACFNDLYVLDADAFHWSTPHVAGDIPIPLRAMTCTAVGKKLIIFGGGDGPAYYNDVYVLDTVNYRWHKPRIIGEQVPSARRAHTACLYKSGIYVFGGGDGVRALNDIWRLDVSDMNKMSWRLVSEPDRSSGGSGSGDRANKPKARGYHTANMVGSKLIIYGGSDGGECFNDVWVYDVNAQLWKSVQIPVPFPRLSHTSTLVGSYLFIIGGHDGSEYSDDVLLLNLVTMSWDKRRVYGLPPSGRGYHGTVLYDSRLLMIGGFDGAEVFGDTWILELAVHAYYSQISHFTIEV